MAHSNLGLVVSAGVLVILLAGCGGTRQIQTAPPRPAPAAVRSAEVNGQMALLTIDVVVGESALPADARALRFRVDQVRVKPRGGVWETYPADVNSFEIAATRRAGSKTIFSTRIPPQRYDSLGLVLSDVFVLYDENAGGPLTMARDRPIELGVALDARAETPLRAELTIEPGASLTQDAACRWFFLPFWTVRVE
ncbi:MAG: hypothetical protein SH809_04880 [Rhodothermales bacterium]|nr:hypothetical protein [Rhodothermales bacterium]